MPTIADRFPTFGEFWNYISKKNPTFIDTNSFEKQLTARWFTGVHYYYRAHTSYWPNEEEFYGRFIAIIFAQFASICKKEKLYRQIYPRLNELWKVKTTSRTTNRGENTKTEETYDKPLFESPDYLVSNYGYHGRSNLVKSVKTTKENTKSDTGAINRDNKLVYNFSETEDRRGISQVLGHFRELDFQVENFINAKEMKMLFLFVVGVPEITQTIDWVTGRTKIISRKEADVIIDEDEKKDAPIITDEEDDLTLSTYERLLRFKKKQERLKKMQTGIVQGKIALRIEHIDRLIEAFEKEIKMPPLGNPGDKLPPRGNMNAKEWKEVLEKASYWAKMNQVVGFEEVKEALESYVKLYEDSVANNYKLEQPMFLLCGKPGVGKSYIATIIAETFNRTLHTIGMNGVKNTSIFNGIPQDIPACNVGEILKGMSDTKHRAPVILVDEFEKCSKEVQQAIGNPTDETINHVFKDNFFELPMPINNVIFILTANYEWQIEGFIKSRLTPINLKPLSFNQRLEIARQQVNIFFGQKKLDAEISKVSDDLLKRIISSYREWGVRKLKKNIERMSIKAREMYLDGTLPTDYNAYPWKFIEGEDWDNGDPTNKVPACPHFTNQTYKHKKDCVCFNGKEIEGWEDEFGEFEFEIA
jgi:ATPase family associated with various cellular activities (AAA)